MNLNDSEQFKILKRFPKFELSYDKQIHKKVYTSNDIFMAIPYGNKFYAWFTYYQEKYVCMLIEKNINKKIKNINIRIAALMNLSDGTILYGTLIDNRFFYMKIFIFIVAILYLINHLITNLIFICNSLIKFVKNHLLKIIYLQLHY